VRKSGLANEKLLNAFLERTGSALAKLEPRKLAGALFREGILTQFQAEQILLGKSRGFEIGNYRVLERLGSGAMALVYLCEHKVMRRRVAIKVLPTNNAKDAAALARFYREGRAASALDHPNIVRAYDIDQDDKHHFLVMEFVDGSLLGEIVRKHGPLSILRACHYIRQAAIGLQHAFEIGLVHRDIKPDNLILDRSGTVKILDMGLARFYADSEDVLTKGILGTPDYLAPEQSQDSHAVDIRADVYSLGGTFYFLLTGKPPFPEGSVAQKLIWHQTRYPKPVREIRPDVPEDLAALIEKMMAKDPAKRFQTPAEVVAALDLWTKTPAPLPSEAEMPRLSPAVRTGATEINPSASTATSAATASLTPPPTPRTPAPAPRPAGKAVAAAQTPAPAPRRPESPPPAPAGPPPKVLVPVPDPEEPEWPSLPEPAGDVLITDQPQAALAAPPEEETASTALAAFPAHAPSRATAAAERRRRRIRLIFFGLVFLTLGLVGAIIALEMMK
jgi:serine/threonine protein kinase